MHKISHFLFCIYFLVFDMLTGEKGQLQLPDLSGLLGGLFGGGAKVPQQVGYRTYVHLADGDAAYDTAGEVVALVVLNQFVKIWQKTIPAQQMLHWGFGSPALPHNQGYLWFVMSDADVGHSEGILRLVQANARETKRIVVAEYDSTNLHSLWVTGKTAVDFRLTDINNMMALPEKVEFPFVGEDSKLIIEYKETIKPTANDICDFSIPITIYQ